MKRLLVMGLEQLEGRRLCSVSVAAGPSAVFEQYVKGSGTSRTFAVMYDGPTAIDRGTLGNDDAWVFGGNDFAARAVFVASAKTKRGNGLIARYRVDGILGGRYNVAMGQGAVADTLGISVDPGVIGGFVVGAKGRTTVIDPSRQTNGILDVAGTTNGPSFSPPAIDTSFGTVIGAFNFGGDAADVVGSGGVNVHFDSWHFGGLGAKRSAGGTRSPFSVAITSSVANDLFDAVTGDQAVFESEVFTFSQSTITMEITGLDPTKKYQFQFLHGDGRLGDFPYASNPLFSLPSGQNVQTFLSFGQTTAVADSATVVRVSGTTGLRYDMPGSSVRGPSFSGLVVAVADGGGPAPAPVPSLVRKSVQLIGPSHLFNLTFTNSSALTAAGLAAADVLVSGPGGYAARALLVGVQFNADGTGQIATYKIDGIETTGTYSISVNGVNVANPTFFHLVPVRWEMAPVTSLTRRRHRVG